MEFYAGDETVAALEARLPTASETERAALLTTLAWYLRERDSQRSARLADAAEALAAPDGIRARLALIRAEAAIFAARFAEAETLLATALALFQSIGDVIGEGDALVLESQMALDQGQVDRVAASVTAAMARYTAAGDPRRLAACAAWSAVIGSIHGEPTDVALAEPAAAEEGEAEPLRAYCRAAQAFRRGDYATAAERYRDAAAALFKAGLVRLAITAVLNTGFALHGLNDLEGQLAESERALALAAPTGWLGLIGLCQCALGTCYQALGRLDEARGALLESCASFRLLPKFHHTALAFTSLAEVNYALHYPAEALGSFSAARGVIESSVYRQLMPRALAGEALCWSALGQGATALGLALNALAAAEEYAPLYQDAALETLARIHLAETLPAPAGMTAPTPALHYLQRLWDLRSAASDWTPEAALLGRFAAAWEQAGDLAQALAYERRRIVAIESEASRTAHDRLAATQMRFDADHARQRAEYLFVIAAEERARLRILQKLGEIGQKITANLDAQSVFETLQHHVGAMADVQDLAIWLLEDGALLDHDGEAAPIPLDSETSDAARAARERREILIDAPDNSAVFAPLMVNDRVLGVMSIRSGKPKAYGEQERLVFRTLCAYGAIALDNAGVYRELEKFASRGSL